jgi:hypothetical protein
MTEFIVNKHCVIDGKSLAEGSIIVVTPQRANNLKALGYGEEYIRKQNVSASTEQKTELPKQNNSEVPQLPTNKKLQITVPKSKPKSK